MKKVLIICLVALTTLAHAQEKPIRLGVKLGVPNIVGFNAEYVTPLLGNKFAPNLDVSYISMKAGSAEATFSYIEIGGNYYFIKEGKGLYGNLSYGRVGFKGDYTDSRYGTGEGKVGMNLVNLKLGAKLGNGFYFRPEIGYALLLGDPTVEVEYTNTTVEEDTPGIFGGVVFNIGIGVAF